MNILNRDDYALPKSVYTIIKTSGWKKGVNYIIPAPTALPCDSHFLGLTWTLNNGNLTINPLTIKVGFWDDIMDTWLVFASAQVPMVTVPFTSGLTAFPSHERVFYGGTIIQSVIYGADLYDKVSVSVMLTFQVSYQAWYPDAPEVVMMDTHHDHVEKGDIKWKY